MSPGNPNPLLGRALLGIGIVVGSGLTHWDHDEHFYYMPDRPAEPPPLLSQKPPTVHSASNVPIHFPNDGRARWE